MASLEFGCLSPPISEQVDTFGVVYDSQRIADFQKDADAITRLKIRHLLPMSQQNTAYDKLAKRIFEHIHNPHIDEAI